MGGGGQPRITWPTKHLLLSKSAGLNSSDHLGHTTTNSASHLPVPLKRKIILYDISRLSLGWYIISYQSRPDHVNSQS